MAAAFVPNKNTDAAIAEKALGNVFAAGTDPWLGKAGALDCLRILDYHQVKQTNILLDSDLTK